MLQKSLASKIFHVFLVTLFFITAEFSFLASESYSDELLEKVLDEKVNQKTEKEKAVAETQKQINEIANSNLSLDQKLAAIDERLNSIAADITASEAELVESEAQLNQQGKELEEKQNEMKRSSGLLYKDSRSSLINLILSKESGSEALRSFVFKKYSTQIKSTQAKGLAIKIADLKLKKEQLNELRDSLNGQKEVLAVTRDEYAAEKARIQAELAAQVASRNSLQSEINSIEAEISTLQAAVLAAKSAGSTSTGSGGVGSGGASSEDFNNNAPAGSFGVFAYGAYTHRLGMSQYGARGRAQSGQTFQQILQAYYNASPSALDTSGNILVTGYGEMDFETTYLYGIAEMPSSWPVEALKAQAIAARTYAWRYKRDGLSICTTEACQVFNPDKSANVPASWKEAVDSTRGLILDGVVTYYSSTAGGYGSPVGWDTTDGVGVTNGSWATQSWEVIGGSPWFYRAWYRQGYTDQGATCGRAAWLNEVEMSDILNSWLVLNRGAGAPGIDNSRIVSTTIGSCLGLGGNPYSESELRSMTINPVTSIIGSPAVVQGNNGRTVTIVFNTNRGIVEVPGSEFHAIFNLRSPGHLRIPQNGFTFINVQRK